MRLFIMNLIPWNLRSVLKNEAFERLHSGRILEENDQILDPEYQLNPGKNWLILEVNWKGLAIAANQNLEMF